MTSLTRSVWDRCDTREGLRPVPAKFDIREALIVGLGVGGVGWESGVGLRMCISSYTILNHASSSITQIYYSLYTQAWLCTLYTALILYVYRPSAPRGSLCTCRCVRKYCYIYTANTNAFYRLNVALNKSIWLPVLFEFQLLQVRCKLGLLL